jgi:hypothetical protein
MTRTKGRARTKGRTRTHRNKTIKRRGGAHFSAAAKRTQDAQRRFAIERNHIEAKEREASNDLLGLTENQIEAAAAAMPLVKKRPPGQPRPFTEKSLFYESRPRILAIIEGIVNERARERKEHPFIEREIFLNPLKEREIVLTELKELNRVSDSYKRLHTPQESQYFGSNRKRLTERLQLIDEQIASEPNTLANPNFVELGVGSSKLASRTRVANGWAYLNVTPRTNNSGRTYVPRSRHLKTMWEEDFDFSLLLVRGFGEYFPLVEVTEATDLSFKYRKQLCEQIEKVEMVKGVKKGNLNRALLLDIIHRAVALMDEGGVFTFDLKPDNVGRLNGRTVFIDFEANTSFWLKVGHSPSQYKSAMILILLSYCYDWRLSDELTKEDLQELAFHFVPNEPSRLFDRGYTIESDLGIDLSINLRVAPSFTDFQVPLKILEAYTTFKYKDKKGVKHVDNNLREILTYFGLTPEFFGLPPE